MRYFAFVDDAGLVLSTLATTRVPGDGRLPENGREITEAQFRTLQGTVAKLVDGAIEPLPARAPVLSLREFFQLFTPAHVAAIASAREGGDAEVAYFWTLLTIEPAPVDLAHPSVAEGLAVLQAKQLLTGDDVVRILAGVAPAKA